MCRKKNVEVLDSMRLLIIKNNLKTYDGLYLTFYCNLNFDHKNITLSLIHVYTYLNNIVDGQLTVS